MKHEHATLRASGTELPVLQSVSAQGILEGLLLSMRLQQTYRNDSAENMEVIYTFPLAWGAVLLGLEATLGDKRMTGQVMARQTARESYEEAVESGDAPVMVEKSASGVFTASLGSLKPGETGVIELSYAQLLSFEQGRIRVVVPTTIAPRYGDHVKEGGLSPDQVAEPSALVEHGFNLSIKLGGAISQARIGSPSHAIGQQHDGEAVTITLQSRAWLDRDFVLLLDDLPHQSFALAGPDARSGPGHTALIASYCPTLPAKAPSPLRLKILIDCSGSMAGDSMEQARAALHPLALQLTQDDQVAYSRFGSHTERVLSPSAATRRHIQSLIEAIDDTGANMGGTELAEALKDTFELRMSPAEHADEADVLLITDGEVWNAQQMIDEARRSGHRIYALGVGTAPAESLLREMAETTGGACEFATPHEDMAVAIQRLLTRIRLAMPVKPKMDTPTQPLWSSPLPRRLAASETVHLFMRLPSATTVPPVLQLGGLDATAGKLTLQDDDLIARLVAAREISLTADKTKAAELAERYQLVTEHTNLLLVFGRAEDEKTDGMPSLHTAKPMLAAGWGGSGMMREPSILFSRSRVDSMTSPMIASTAATAWRSPRWRTNPSTRVDLAFGDLDDFEIPAFLRRDPDPTRQTGRTNSDSEPHYATAEQIVAAYNTSAVQAASFRSALRAVTALPLSARLRQAIENVAVKVGRTGKAWACYLLWLHENGTPGLSLSIHGLAFVKEQVKDISPEMRAICDQVFENWAVGAG